MIPVLQKHILINLGCGLKFGMRLLKHIAVTQAQSTAVSRRELFRVLRKLKVLEDFTDPTVPLRYIEYGCGYIMI